MPSVDRRPLHLRVAQMIEQQIRDGVLKPGDELPSVRRLAMDWNIGASTAKDVLHVLRDDGWIEIRAGLVSVVTSQRRPSVANEDSPTTLKADAESGHPQTSAGLAQLDSPSNGENS